jgi:hypothetical protein
MTTRKEGGNENYYARLMETVKKLFVEVFQKGELDVADEILTEDFRFQYPFPGFSPGRGGIKEFTTVFHKAFPGFELDINDLFAGNGISGPRAGIRWTFRGKHKSDFLGVRETEKDVTFSAIGIYGPIGGEGNGIKLALGWLEMDTTGLLQQLSVVRQTDELLPSLRFKQ